jgi:hypothetical protein
LGDQGIGTTGRQIFSGLQVPGEPFLPGRAKDLSAPRYSENVELIEEINCHVFNSETRGVCVCIYTCVCVCVCVCVQGYQLKCGPILM